MKRKIFNVLFTLVPVESRMPRHSPPVFGRLRGVMGKQSIMREATRK